MGYVVDHTGRFREQVKELARVYPPKPRADRGKHLGAPENAKAARGQDVYLPEAYSILGHIHSLSGLLYGIRKAYLNVDVSAKFREPTRQFDLSSGSHSWADIRHLSNEERDQIDLQARIIISQCAERVSRLEKLEAARVQSASRSAVNSLTKFLPSLISLGDPFADLVAAHRSNITWYLTRRLTELSQSQKEMQEERIRRQLDRSRTLGSIASVEHTKAAAIRDVYASMGSSSSNVPSSHIPVTAVDYIESDTDDDADIELTQSQILQFEEENSAILKSMEDTLQSVQLAESRLLEISALQTELVVQLARQTEMVDTLYDEAMTTQTQVEKGNVQLKQARERGRNSRKWILLFILMATFALLFLHLYD
ncbi:uncharacterized protein EI90DRAFT_2989133 [Cantharellus anzutake]|uniref:uncharacterized protein n=1 Tax=Cantharellus anzutake TaxID=1750568 RepID=UPI0019084A1C|nr:uncharacterized protein EI90DRAFT_2989133 [Cantharellus anzutake]KAF8341367.1 hypothetical protein EI90DRAFT_2989133 [Cantharellus anzutake]